MDKQQLKEAVGELNLVDTVSEAGGVSYIDTAVSVMQVYDLIDQLDEPEVLSQEWIEDNTFVVTDEDGDDYAVVENRKLKDKLVPKQELPVIPKYVADWIKKAKRYHSISWVLNYENIKNWSNELTLWCFESGNDDNLHKLARAWLDGYKVEEEPLYYVINNGNYFLLAKDKWNGFIFSTRGNSRLGGAKNSPAKFKLTEQEIKDYDERYWAFAKPVEEMEE